MSRTKRKWTLEEEDALRRGVQKHGHGKWKSICQDSDFSSILLGRTAVDIKDKWRNMNPKTSGQGSRSDGKATALVPYAEDKRRNMNPKTSGQGSRSDGKATALVPYAEGEALVCLLCCRGKLTFEPPPIRCTKCNARIKRNGIYFTRRGGDAQDYVCDACHDKAAIGTFAELEEKKNDEETEELWVKCDRCKNLAHQICALYNGEKKDAYTCVTCLSNQEGKRWSLPRSVPLGAKSLPRTILSNHLEKRLFKFLKIDEGARERRSKGRYKLMGRGELVIRVVSSVEKTLDVNQQFLEIFQEENYPTKFPYKSKVILLFQKFGESDVCLFAMYVQEFGSKCPLPNQRCVYLSSLDSTKYYRPNTKAATGEPYYTKVYHEILIGYLEYCKKQGFARCYIRASPPLEGEDCIFYCLREMEKVPEINNFQDWYLGMLGKAFGEDIVIDVTNLYDRFFVPGGGFAGGGYARFFVPGGGECKAKVTLARLPYFDSDYWPATAKELINQICQEEETVAGTSAQVDPSANVSKDKLFMDKLGKIICEKKKDYIVVDLQYFCGHCDRLITGTQWQCKTCKRFKLCDGCFDANKGEKSRDANPIDCMHGGRHYFNGCVITTVACNTDDKDIVLEPELFQSRQAFLTFCQRNYYQFDDFRRTRHSSMMILHHLNNQAAPTSVATCNICHLHIENGWGWQCEFCPSYALCKDCHQHPHELHNSDSHVVQNQESGERKVLLQKFALDFLVHAAQCRFPDCTRENCSDVREYFYHQSHCKKGRLGGCLKCLCILDMSERHSQDCKESECHVPLCKQRREKATAFVPVETGTPQHGQINTDVECQMT